MPGGGPRQRDSGSRGASGGAAGLSPPQRAPGLLHGALAQRCHSSHPSCDTGDQHLGTARVPPSRKDPSAEPRPSQSQLLHEEGFQERFRRAPAERGGPAELFALQMSSARSPWQEEQPR